MLSLKSLYRVQKKIPIFLYHFIVTLSTVPGLYVKNKIQSLLLLYFREELDLKKKYSIIYEEL